VGHTLAEKILMRNTGAENVQPGDIVITRPDKVAFLDIYSPFVYKQFKEMGFKKLADPDRVLIIEDHEIPTSLREDPWSLTFSHKFAEEFGVKNHLVGKGIGHQLMAEMRFAKPGSVIYVTDSHTTTYGAVGSFATGIGYTEMAAVLGTGKMWVRVPAAIKIQIDGALPKGVYSKDIILQVLGDLTASGGTYKSLEFCGTTVDSLSVDARLTMSNMAVECGGKVGLFAPDAKTCEYSAVEQESVAWLQFDDDARYERGLHYDAATLVPNLSCPQYVDNVHPVSEKEGLEVNQIFLGSCTNGRIEDLAVAAQILEGHHVPARVKFIVTPASVAIYRQAVKLGYIQTLVRAGAIVTQPFCSLCQGRGSGLLSDGEVVLGSHNRNFLGRMGSAKSLIFLGSPATVAASALRGKITDPREVLE